MIIKKSCITLIVPILFLVPSVFTLPFFLIYTFQSSLLAIVPTFIDGMLVLWGLITLNQFIRFGRKLMVIGTNELTFCTWSIKRIPWIHIKDIQLKTELSSDYIEIQTASPRKMTISLNMKTSCISNENIYSCLLETWMAANDRFEDSIHENQKS